MKDMEYNLSRYINESDYTEYDDNFQRKSGKNFKFIDINNSNIDKYLDQDSVAKKYKKWLNIMKGEIAVDKETDRIAGLVLVRKDKDQEGFITPVQVCKEYRGYGLGDRLTKDAINKYGAKDLTVNINNTVAIELYKKNGFVIINKYKENYYMKHKKYISRSTALKEKSVMAYNTILPCFTPKEMEELGVFSNIAEENHYNVVTDHKYHDNYVYYLSTGEVLPEYIYNLREAYENYMKDKSDTNKQELLELGWNPEVDLSDKAIMESSRLTKNRLANDGYKPLKIIDLTK